MDERFASGSWHVREGSEQAFVDAWTDLLGWTAREHPAFIAATLLRDQNDPRHFVSFARWTDQGARAAWKGSEGFASGHATCRSFCDDFYGSDYDRSVEVAGAAAGAVTG